MGKHFYLTTPIFYPNANLHLGHAYTTTLSDIIVRYHRNSLGEKTYFLTGADENTQKVLLAARNVGKDSRVFLDETVENFKKLFSDLNISFDQFIRTSDQKMHWPGAQLLWSKIHDSGDLEKREYEGLYCLGHEAFITEKELVNGKCPDHDMIPQRLKEENYFFKLSRYSGEIKKRIESKELSVLPASREAEILSLLGRGLEDVSFSRPKTASSIGIPVPKDDSQVIYVWCDALANYITALGYGRGGELMEFWPADVHVIGKDILRFHAAIWPGMLLSAGLPLPKTLLVHGFITSGGKKMSKTLGNVIDPQELLDEYGSEAVRYFLARHISPFEDGDITRKSFKEAYNANLANGLGNLVSRIMKMASENITAAVNREQLVSATYNKAFAQFDVKRAIDVVWEFIALTDRTIQEEQPFKLISTDREKAIGVIQSLVSKLGTIACLLAPFMPGTSEKINDCIRKNKKPENLFPRKE